MSDISEISKKVKVKGASNLFDDAVTVQINMKEVSPGEKKKLSPKKNTLATEGDIASMILEQVLDETSTTSNKGKLEVKITINMKQIERHHRDIEMYVSPFEVPPDSIYLRIPLQPDDYDRIERARDELDHLVRICHQLTPEILPPLDSKNFLQKLRKIDVRCSALYPRPPAPGDKEKKSPRMCPHYEPEIEDIEQEIQCITGILEGVQYFHRLDMMRCSLIDVPENEETTSENPVT